MHTCTYVLARARNYGLTRTCVGGALRAACGQKRIRPQIRKQGCVSRIPHKRVENTVIKFTTAALEFGTSSCALIAPAWSREPARKRPAPPVPGRTRPVQRRQQRQKVQRGRSNLLLELPNRGEEDWRGHGKRGSRIYPQYFGAAALYRRNQRYRAVQHRWTMVQRESNFRAVLSRILVRSVGKVVLHQNHKCVTYYFRTT